MKGKLQMLVMLGVAMMAGCSECVAQPNVVSTFTPITLHQPEVEKLTLELRMVAPQIESSPQLLLFTLTNHGDQPATIVTPGDGSAWGMRTPVIRWSPDFHSGLARCGNINALKAAQIITLGPGEKMEFPGWRISSASLPGPGKHLVKVEMEHIPDMPWSTLPLGKHDPAAMDAARRLNAYKLVSNTIEIEVAEP